MKTLVVAATIEEIRGIYEHFGLPLSDFVETPDFDLLVTGVGMTATAFALGRHLSDAYGQVLSLGIAGAFNTSIPLGSLVYINKDTFSELGAEDHSSFLPIDELGFGTCTYTQERIAHAGLDDLITVTGITVNTVHGNAGTIAAVLSRLHPDVESMEGAAVLYACQQYAIPCIPVRSISNYVEPRDKGSWKIGLAIKNLNDWAISFLTPA
jgi:futalosine hydrolase